MNRTFLLALLTYAFILAGLATFNQGLIIAGMICVVYIAAGYLFSFGEINVEIQRSIEPGRVSPDTPIEIHLSIRNKGDLLAEFFLKDLLPPKLHIIAGSNDLLTEIKSGETIEHSYTVCGGRGIYFYDDVQVKANDRLGMITRQELVKAQGSIFIMPYVPKIKHVSIRPRQTRDYSGTIPARIGGPGVEFFGVRAYQDGDPLHRINWRTSARFQNSLFSNDYMQERVTDIGLILDARQLTNIQTRDGNLFEHQISAVAAMADTLLTHGNRVGLLIYGHFLDWTFPGYGKVQRERIFHALARAQIGDSLVFEDLANLPTKVFPIKSQIILFSSLREEDSPFLINLRARGYQVMIISPDPIIFQLRDLPRNYETELGARLSNIERNILINKLRNAGIIVLSWDTSIPFDSAMQLTLHRLSLFTRASIG